MTARSEHEVPWDDDFWEVSHAAARLTQYACEVAARCLDDGMLRLQFTQEMAYVGKGIVEEVRTGRKTAEEGLKKIREEHRSLYSDVVEYMKIVAGLGSGILQVAGGVAVCKYSAGLMCGTAGMALVQHGMNNVYENGRNIIQGRNDTVGPLRRGYQEIAKSLGGKASHGNIAYGLGDLLLSGYSLGRFIVLPTARRLFRYIDSDKVRAHMAMGAGPLTFELGVNVLTGDLIWVEWNKE